VQAQSGDGEVRGGGSFRNLRSSDGSDFRLKAEFIGGRRYFRDAPIADFAGWIAKALTGREHQSSSSQAGADCAKHPVGLRAKGLSARRE
jgi:hypothetical protein